MLNNIEVSEIIDSVISSNAVAENASAQLTAMSTSNNEVANLSHILCCLSSEDFERFILSVRTIRETAKSFSLIAQNNKDLYKDSLEQVNSHEIPIQPSLDRFESKKRPRLQKKTTEKLDISYMRLILEYLKDKPNGEAWRNIAEYCFKEIYGDEKDHDADLVEKYYKRFNASPLIKSMNIEKHNGVWKLRNVKNI